MKLHDSLSDFPVTPISPTTSGNISIGFQFHSTRIEYKVLLIVLRAQMGVAPKYLRDAIGVDSGGSPGTRPPIIRMGGKTPNNHMRILRKNLFVKINMKESRNREKERKIQRKGSKFVHFHSFIHSAISIAPLQVLYYSEALPTTARILYRSFTPKRTGNCR